MRQKWLATLAFAAAAAPVPAAAMAHAAAPDAPAVSYTAPPPPLTLTPFASVPAPGLPEMPVFVAAFADGAAVVSATADGAQIVYVGNDGTISAPMPATDIPLAVAPGPDHVVYVLVPSAGSPGPGHDVLAISLAGDTTGHVANRTPTDATTFWGYLADVPFANTASGLIDLESGSARLTTYVDHLGVPISVPELPAAAPQRLDDVVTDPTTNAEWRIEIERHPDYAPPWQQGEDPPVRSSDGVILVPEHIGASPDSMSGDVDPTIPILAVLQPELAPRWFSVPDGWQLASSDVWGTVFMRSGAGSIELARLDVAAFPAPPAPPTTASVTTAGPVCPSYRSHTAHTYPIRLCDSGDLVIYVQAVLNGNGYDVSVDGYFGPGTESTVRSFQVDHGLAVDGLVGPSTWAALIAGCCNAFSVDADGNGRVDVWEFAADAGGSHEDLPAAFPPQATTLTHGGSVWAVVLAGSAASGDGSLTAAIDDASFVGYATGVTDCDSGAAEALGQPDSNYTVSVYLRSEADARLAADLFGQRGVDAVAALVRTFCLD